MYDEFLYINEKIMNAPFEMEPFPFLYIENFLSDEHFEKITQHRQINFPEFESAEQLIVHLEKNDYKAVPFPGCTTSASDYLKWYNTGEGKHPGHTKGLLEGFGMSYRIQDYYDEFTSQLMAFLNSKSFILNMHEKFGFTGGPRIKVETAIQKYLTGYEISPHPDIRKKQLTYMLNINPKPVEGCGTHFMKFKPERKMLQDFWKFYPGADRCWVPWDWCGTVFTQVENNSITIFAPHNASLHSVKLDYDMLNAQRTQIYGNFWYERSHTSVSPAWDSFNWS